MTGCTPFHSAEMEAIAFCGFGQPDDAEQHLLASVPGGRRGTEPSRMRYTICSPIQHGRLRAILAADT